MSIHSQQDLDSDTGESSRKTRTTEVTGTRLRRRTVLAAAGVVGAAGVLAACGGSDSEVAGDAESGDTDKTTDVPDDSAAIASTSDVPVGGAVFVESRSIVVTQPSDGEFKAFEARCPHQGCMTSDTENEDLMCPCHGSLFSAETGEVLRGPALTGLPEVSIKVSGTDIVTA